MPSYFRGNEGWCRERGGVVEELDMYTQGGSSEGSGWGDIDEETYWNKKVKGQRGEMSYMGHVTCIGARLRLVQWVLDVPRTSKGTSGCQIPTFDGPC